MVQSRFKITPFRSVMPKLVAVRGPLAGSTFFLYDEPVTIGRHSSNDINLNDTFASRRHCVVTRIDEAYRIVDCHSSNGTYVSGKRVQEAMLTDGCDVRVGRSTFVFWMREFNELESGTVTDAKVRGSRSQLFEVDAITNIENGE